jgi:hypothetical protein
MSFAAFRRPAPRKFGRAARARAERRSVNVLRAGRSAMLSARSQSSQTMPNRFNPAARHSFREERRARADRKVADLKPVIAELRASGVTSLRGIAAALNERGIPPWPGPVVGIMCRWGGCWRGYEAASERTMLAAKSHAGPALNDTSAAVATMAITSATTASRDDLLAPEKRR